MFKPGKHILHMIDSHSTDEFFVISLELAMHCAETIEQANAELSAEDGHHLSSVNGADGKPYAFILSRELWNLVRRDLHIGEEELNMQNGVVKSEPLDDFRRFMDSWDFPYEYSPAVKCPVCGSETEDWRTDPFHPFLLSNANMGGLLVFHCTQCGSTIRQKHFKDKMVTEFTPAARKD
ncbi:MAG: hypothetical protein PUK52_10210 [Desulfovibrio sp.]|jgi:hypothetical protein|nr:hypothetical protein [Desulfovibrio sp.]